MNDAAENVREELLKAMVPTNPDQLVLTPVRHPSALDSEMDARWFLSRLGCPACGLTAIRAG
jgi:hypothetical protein